MTGALANTEVPTHTAAAPKPNRIGALLLVLSCVGAGSGCGEAEPALPPAAPAHPLRSDPRVAELFYDCARNDPYLRDTSEMRLVLIEKLESGQKEPLRRAKEELMAAGDSAVALLDPFITRHFADSGSSPYLQNSLEVLSGIETPAATALLLRCLDHSVAEVRGRALRALARRSTAPEQYDRLALHLELEGPEVQPLVAKAMHGANPERAELEFLGWLASGENSAMGRYIAPLVSGTRSPEVMRQCAELVDEMPLSVRGAVACAALRGGDERGRKALEELSAHEIPQTRLSALEAYGSLGDVERVTRFLREDESENVRLAAVAQLAQMGANEALVVALDDSSDRVRSESQRRLLQVGEATARARALADLGAASNEIMRNALDVLREPMQTDPALASEAFEKLRGRFEREVGRDFAARKATLQVIGQIPVAEAPELLLTQAETLPAEIEGLKAHRWCALQAANSGLAGQAWMIEHLPNETDPVRRLDLLWAIGTHRNDVARDTLLGVAQSPDVDSHELLFIASMLAKLGPSARMAPVLKQATLRVDDYEVRGALQCLLWKWY